MQARPKTAVAAWIYAGGTHHTGFSYSVTTEHIEDLGEIADVEVAIIDATTNVRDFKQTLRTNELYYHIAPASGACRSTRLLARRRALILPFRLDSGNRMTRLLFGEGTCRSFSEGYVSRRTPAIVSTSASETGSGLSINCVRAVIPEPPCS